MKNGVLLFIGLFAVALLPFAGIVLGSNGQLGRQAPYYDDADSEAYPLRQSGVATQGEAVYRDLNCAACHTEQVRRAAYGADLARGWGERQSVARDYIFRSNAQLGEFRIGPDLANLGGRKPSAPDEQDLYNLLYLGQGGMPAYPFLFATRKVIGEPSELALHLTGRNAPPLGQEIVPSRRAQQLAAYLLSLNSTYSYPEARPAAPAKEEKK